MDAHLNNLNKNYFLYQVAAIAAIGGFLFGFDTGIISGALIFLEKSFQITTLAKEMIVSSVVLGAFIGSIFSGRIADYYGRRKTLIAAATLFLIGTTLTTFTVTVFFLIVGRFILGIAIGIAAFTVPLFISEMAPADKRGSLVLLNAVTITGGEAIAFIVDYALTPTHSWRLMFATGYIPAIALILGMLSLPETPRWLSLKGLSDEAADVLKQIRNNSDVTQELQAIKKSIGQSSNTWKDLFSYQLRPAIIIGLGLGVLQQFVGINTVMYYGPYIFKAAGFHSAGAQIFATFGMGMINMVVSIIAVFIVDKFGRRPLLISGMIIAAISLGMVGLLFQSQNAAAQWLIVLFMITYISGYCISLGSLFWLIISEIYPLRMRGLAMSFVAGIQWAANFIVAITFLTILNKIGPSMTFWLYGLMCMLTIIFVFFLVPETKGVTLEEIESNLDACRPPRRMEGQLEQGKLMA